MEIEELNNTNYLNKIICKECGLPLIINSYEMMEPKKLIIKLNCSNPDHKKININFEDFKKLINYNLNNNCKCMLCQKIVENDKAKNYCYYCQKIICLGCKEKHNIHNNICEYKYYKNKYLKHNYNNVDYSSSDHLSDIISNVNFIDEKDEKDLSSQMNDINIMNCNIYENDIRDNSLIRTNNEKYINIIYHDVNLLNHFKGIVDDCNFFESEINGSIILTNNFTNLHLVLETILKNKSKSKFFLIVNGGSAKDTINKIIEYNYKSLFLGAFIYTIRKKKKDFGDLFEKNSDFIKGLYKSAKDIIESIKKLFNDEKIINDKFLTNKLINYKSFEKGLRNLKEEVIHFYGDELENSFKENIEKMKEFIKEREFPNEMKNNIIKDFDIFSELKNKNYESIMKY
jgi:hypothetical protein